MSPRGDIVHHPPAQHVRRVYGVVGTPDRELTRNREVAVATAGGKTLKVIVFILCEGKSGNADRQADIYR